MRLTIKMENFYPAISQEENGLKELNNLQTKKRKVYTMCLMIYEICTIYQITIYSTFHNLVCVCVCLCVYSVCVYSVCMCECVHVCVCVCEQ